MRDARSAFRIDRLHFSLGHMVKWRLCRALDRAAGGTDAALNGLALAVRSIDVHACLTVAWCVPASPCARRRR